MNEYDDDVVDGDMTVDWQRATALLGYRRVWIAVEGMR